MHSAVLSLSDAAATEAAGARLATALSGGMIVTLSGDLGSGKTTLTRGCLRGLGWPGVVKSPSYTLVELYPLSSLYFYHFDFYRFTDPSEWEYAGFAECFRSDSVCMIEWPERVRGMLPDADVAFTLSYASPTGTLGRELQLTAHSARGERCLSAVMSGGVGLTA